MKEKRQRLADLSSISLCQPSPVSPILQNGPSSIHFFDGWLCYLSFHTLASANHWPEASASFIVKSLKLLWFPVYLWSSLVRASRLAPWQFAETATVAIVPTISPSGVCSVLALLRNLPLAHRTALIALFYRSHLC